MSINLTPASLYWQSDGTPVSELFEDIYFSSGEGLAETQHVFIGGNHLPERWQCFSQDSFVIGETGFGTGLNFLAVWAAFKTFRQEHPAHPLKKLRFVSVEKFPVMPADLEKAYQRLPELSLLSQELISRYPKIEKGCHQVELGNGEILLELWFSDVQEMMTKRISLLNRKTYPEINAWFLDGFAPSKNPQMWQQSLFDNIAQQSKEGTSIATFTAAGFVRRGLISAGFNMKKAKGFGRKKDMLTGQYG